MASIHTARRAPFSCAGTNRRQVSLCRGVSRQDGCQTQSRRDHLLNVASLMFVGAVPTLSLPEEASAKAAAAGSPAGEWSSPGLNVPEDENLPKFFKTDTGIKVQELVVGSGVSPQMGDRVLIDYVLRRPNGYFIYSTVEGVSFQPRDVPVGPVSFIIGQEGSLVIPGLQEVVTRMRQGGKIRALIPPEQGYMNCNTNEPQPPTFATKRQLVNYCKGPLLFEIALLRVTKP